MGDLKLSLEMKLELIRLAIDNTNCWYKDELRPIEDIVSDFTAIYKCMEELIKE